MPAPRLSAEVLQQTADLVRKHGGVSAAARASGIKRATLQARWGEARTYKPAEPAKVVHKRAELHTSGVHKRQNVNSPDDPPRRHVYIPDTQVRPGVPLDYIDWIAQAVVHYKPDVIVVGGDWFDFPSLNSHSAPGSMPLEGQRYQADLDAGNAAFARFCKPIEAEEKRDKKWKPRKVFTVGNHEDRADRAAISDPKWLGHVGSNNCNVRDFEWHGFLKRVVIDGICYSHYFQNSHSRWPIGGTVNNRLSRIGCSFTQGHVQGFDYGTKITGSGATWHGIVAGSCYLHREDYRGNQGQRHWRGIIVKNEVRDGDYCVMPLTLDYLCRKNTGLSLYRYMMQTYPEGDWEHLA